MVFNKSGTRAYFRTSRWVHRASSSVSGLVWIDALFTPNPLQGGGIVFGNGTSAPNPASRLFLPVAKNGFIEFVELNFSTSASTGIFGSRDDLLQEWRSRINAYLLEVF